MIGRRVFLMLANGHGAYWLALQAKVRPTGRVVVFHDSDLKPELVSKETAFIDFHDLKSLEAYNEASVVWFERVHLWGTERKMLINRIGPLLTGVRFQW